VPIKDYSHVKLGHYRRSAKRYGLTLAEFIEKYETGQSICYKCKVWKQRTPGNFFLYVYNISSVVLTCRGCGKFSKTQLTPQEIKYKRAAARLSIPMEEYQEHREAGDLWCTIHGWIAKENQKEGAQGRLYCSQKHGSITQRLKPSSSLRCPHCNALILASSYDAEQQAYLCNSCARWCNIESTPEPIK